jgi:hypothetical protein
VVRRILLAFLLVTSVAWAADPDAEKRGALWKAFAEVSRDDVRVYAENPSLTQICYRAGGKTLLFSLASGKVEQIMHAKMVPFVNRITYERTASGAAFVLWYNGAEQLRVGVDAD